MKIRHDQQKTNQNSDAPLPALEYKPLHGSHVGAFSCGEHELDRWFKKRALDEHKKYHARVTVATFEGEANPVAFYALSTRLVNERDLAKNEKNLWGQTYKKYDQVYICLSLDYLAVAKKYQKQGLGKIIMGRVLDEFVTIAKMSSIQLLTGRAISRDVFQFYKNLGFLEYGTDSRQPSMFLAARTVIEMVDQVGELAGN